MAVVKYIITLLALRVLLAYSLNCGDKCCFSYKLDINTGKCIECESGFIGVNCSEKCSIPYYGKRCSNMCRCKKEVCHFARGCMDGSGETQFTSSGKDHHEPTSTSVLTSRNRSIFNNPSSTYTTVNFKANYQKNLDMSIPLKTSIISLAFICVVLIIAYISTYVYEKVFLTVAFSRGKESENVYENEGAIEMQVL